MNIILNPARREAHTVKFTVPADVIDEPAADVELTFEPKAPLEVATEHLAHLRDDFRDGVLLVCRQDKATGRVEYAHKLSKLLAEANEAEVIAIANGEATKARLTAQLAAGPTPTVRKL